MNLLERFDAVEVKPVCHISEADKQFCEKQQAAYTAALYGFQELIYFWEDIGQFFTPPKLCELVMSCLRISEYDLIADLTCGMGNFFNYVPSESNVYGCELDQNAYKVARFLYPKANLVQGDIRAYQPDVRFDFVVGNGRGTLGQTA